MKLSDAIRLGAMLRPQVRAMIFGSGGSCAFGAALEAHGIAYDERPILCAALIKKTIVIQQSIRHVTRCPICSEREANGRIILEHLNDDHLWTREQIADWVEQVELPDGDEPILRIEPQLEACDDPSTALVSASH